jgi:predicted CXXCH cytochrome family protein
VSAYMDILPEDDAVSGPRLTTGIFCLLGIALPFAANFRVASGQTTEHPFIEPDAIKSETCLTCHPDKREGKFVHSAVAIGCDSCHQATSEGSKTTVTLVATDGELCGRCHEAKREPVVHEPYGTGQCLVCHNPHSSDFPRQTRAATEMLCMSCHGTSRPDVKVAANARTVSVLGGRTLDLAAYEKAPKISPGHPEKGALPAQSVSVPAKAPLKPAAELDCISCHDPHASKAEHLLRDKTESRHAVKPLGPVGRADTGTRVPGPVQQAAVDMRFGAWFDCEPWLPYELSPSEHHRGSGVRDCGPEQRRTSQDFRTDFIGGRQ